MISRFIEVIWVYSGPMDPPVLKMGNPITSRTIVRFAFVRFHRQLVPPRIGGASLSSGQNPYLTPKPARIQRCFNPFGAIDEVDTTPGGKVKVTFRAPLAEIKVP